MSAITTECDLFCISQSSLLSHSHSLSLLCLTLTLLLPLPLSLSLTRSLIHSFTLPPPLHIQWNDIFGGNDGVS